MEEYLKEFELRIILTKLNTVYSSVPYGYDTPKSMKISHQNRRQTKTIFRYMPEHHLAIFVTIVILTCDEVRSRCSFYQNLETELMNA